MTKTEKKIIALFLSVVLFFGVAPATGIAEHFGGILAEGAGTYNASAAVNYAKAHWDDGVGLCAQFVSECLKAGGCSCYSTSASQLFWALEASGLGQVYQLNRNSDGITISYSAHKNILSVGDPIFYYSAYETDGKPYEHTALVTGIDDQDHVLITQHNTAHVDYPYHCTNSLGKTITATYVFHFTQSKPTNCSISVNKSTITVGETVTFTYSISGATTKGIGIDKVFSDGSYTRDKSFAVSADSGTIDYTFKQAGKYCCIIEGSNAAGYSCSPGVYVTVSEPKPILTIYYDCFRSSPTIDTTKGYYFGDYNRICTTSSAEPHQTAWDTPNVYYQTVKLGETLGVNGLHDFATFGLTAPTGYAFAGWRSGDNGALLNETTRYTATDLTDEINSGDCDVWLSASFTPRSFTVTFDANGGLCDAAEKTVTYDSTYGALPVPTRTGYSFDGWYRFIGIKDGVQVGLLGEITSASTVSVADNHTLHALWSANQITVTFDANGGTCDTVSKTVAFDSPYGELPVPARTGYNFDGWYRSIGIMDGVQVGLLGEITSASIVGVANNHTLYAFWGANQYTVTFDSEGGTCDTVSKTVTFDSPYGELPVPVRAGYTFLGWCPPIYIPDIDGKPMFYITSTSIVKNARNHTLSAFWEANTYTVSLNPVDGECVFTAITVYADGVYGVLPVPKREGYTFIGWFLDDGTLVTEDMPVTILADHALTAHWTRLYVTPVLSTASTAVLDETRGFLYGLDFGVTEEELRTQYLSLTGDGRIEIESDGAIGTGTVVRLINEETGETAATYTIVIFGDINGDGILNSTDLNLLRSMSANLVTFDSTSAQYFAADLTHDGIVNSTDVTEIRAVNARIRTVKQTI